MGLYGTYYSDIVNKPSCVYRLHDNEGALLYIGISTNPFGRVAQHRSRQPWGRQIDHMSVQWYRNREAAKAAERFAIYHEDPLHNAMRPQMECC